MMAHISNDCGIAEEYLFLSRLLLFTVSGYSMCNHSMCNSTAFQCLNLSQERCTTVALTIRIMDLVASIISTSLLLCLLLVFKRKAWNSPVKRLTLMIATCFGLLEFVDASLELYNNILQRTWFKVFFLLTYYTAFAILLYLIVILANLLFQIGVAIVPGEWKHKVKSRLHLLEVAIHLLIPILSLSFSAGVIVVYKRDDNCSPWIAVKNIIYIVCYLGFVNLRSLWYYIPATVLP